jgi:carbonic anhydrase
LRAGGNFGNFRPARTVAKTMNLTPSASLDALLRGNAWAREQGRAAPQRGERRPTAAVLACTDERVVPQVIFDHPPGKIYTVRMAGNVYTPEVAGSLEIAVDRLGCPLIVVLGHTDCTAVHLAHSRAKVEGGTFEVTRRIAQAVRPLPPAAPLLEAIEANVRHTIRELRERCRPLHDLEAEGRIQIAGAVYELETGHVRLL